MHHDTTQLFEPKGTTRFIPDASASAPPAPTARTRAQIEAWAKRATAANGFGEAGKVVLPADPGPVRIPARESTWQRFGRVVARFITAWVDYRRRRAEQDLLARLDAATLRDLGIDRCEIGSYVAESDGSSSITRRRVAPSNLQVFETSRPRIKSIDRLL
ncbi:MAG TPA: DUF1127 domain-containing protein [Burkholderiaceae bacterium]|nr:DUF1127 domain-containing protein [Burkholderiaceae bacterium]